MWMEVTNMLPIIHPVKKTEIELKRGVQRLELYASTNDDTNAKQVLDLLRQALQVIKN